MFSYRIGRISRRARVVAVTAAVGLVALATAGGAVAVATGGVGFDGKPGTKKPPAKLHHFKMTQFGKDNRPVGSSVTFVDGPTGKVTFSHSLEHLRVGPTGWKTWSHHYKGDVYYSSSGTVTLKLPSGTKAFYLYIEPNAYVVHHVIAKADGASSGDVTVKGKAGARYFGFFAKTKAAHVTSVKVSCDDQEGFAIGEFGIAK